MAAFTTVVTEKRNARIAPQNATIGSQFTKTFTFTIPANTVANDTAVVGSLPANVAIVGCYIKANVASTANSTVALKTTTANKVFANATALTTSWLKITGANDTSSYTSSGDDTITATIGTANEANAVTVTCTLNMISLDDQAAGRTTYTV